MSDRAPYGSMGLSDLDGFLTGIVVGPELIMPSEWLPVILGGDEPEFANGSRRQAYSRVYSFRDVVALRTLAQLRRHIPLQELRRAPGLMVVPDLGLLLIRHPSN